MVFGGVLFLVVIACWLWALVECILTPASRCRNLPKLVWLVLIVLLGIIGAIAWLFLGRPRRGGSPSESARPSAPRRGERLPASPPAADAGPMSDRRSAELDRRLEAWEAEQARLRDTGAPEEEEWS